MKSSRESSGFNILIVLILILVALALFALTLGTVDVRKAKSDLEEEQVLINSQIKWLQKKISKREKLKTKLDKYFRIAEFFLRLIILSIWGVYICVLCKLRLVADIGDFFNYSNAFMLFVFLLSFLIFGEVNGLLEYYGQLKEYLKKVIRGKHREIETQLEKEKFELQTLTKKSEDLDNTIKDFDKGAI